MKIKVEYMKDRAQKLNFIFFLKSYNEDERKIRREEKRRLTEAKQIDQM